MCPMWRARTQHAIEAVTTLLSDRHEARLRGSVLTPLSLFSLWISVQFYLEGSRRSGVLKIVAQSYERTAARSALWRAPIWQRWLWLRTGKSDWLRCRRCKSMVLRTEHLADAELYGPSSCLVLSVLVYERFEDRRKRRGKGKRNKKPHEWADY